MSKLTDKLKESLNEVSKAVAEGSLSDSSLIRACENYKERIGFKESSDYRLIKSKTFNNFMVGVPNSDELIKALILGETKVMNGVTYVVKQTKSGKLDWRVANKQPKKTKDSKTTNVDLLFDVQDFPTQISDVKFKHKLGGSTGAELVEDSQGNLYVKKQGASSGHVKEEFLTNCIYKVMGASVPTMKLYDDNGKATILSKFMEDTTPLNNLQLDDQYLEDMTKFYVLDCLLANWDIYKNDNILVNNSDDDIVRVDNGGGLRYSAQGRDKGAHFTDEVDEIETMLANNPHLAPAITTKSLNVQINKIVKNKSKILSLIEDKDLRDKIDSRIKSLDMRLVNAGTNKDPYRELTDAELDKAYKACKGDLFATNDVEGWVFLSKIAKMRGFDGTPTVMEPKEFDKLMKEDENILINRGLQGFGNRSALGLMKEFTESEHCFYGKQAMYGAGIYGAVNKDKTRDSKNHDFDIAMQYSGYQENHILDIILPADMKIVDAQELDEMMSEEFFGDEFKEAKKEYDEAVVKINELKKDKEDIERGIEEGAKAELGYNERVLKVLLKSKPEEVYADTTKFKFEKILRYFNPIMKSINGKINKIDDKNYEFKLHNGKTFMLSRTSSEMPEALKVKNSFYNPYNYQYKLLKQFLVKEHFHDIDKKVQRVVENARRNNPKLLQIKKDVSTSEKQIKELSDNLNKVRTDGNSSMNSVLAEIAKRPKGEFRGFYAAIKGYDAIIQKNGWGGKTDFCVILNRSKVIVKDFNNE